MIASKLFGERRRAPARDFPLVARSGLSIAPTFELSELENVTPVLISASTTKLVKQAFKPPKKRCSPPPMDNHNPREFTSALR
ncbi:hypothetical protein EVAR_86051_1 [Eumeta japonica]|uniref:Uncharacterized protein n=1 Tax=Eumeta variegata TaxID=151549 RepID=A0A4C1UJE6_EUMVA|nr:hypothetical protein EVAR_86051_1 [Eumeta japonica]